MGRLLRSPYSNPIDAGLNTGVRVLNIMDALEDRPVKREMMQMELAHKKAQMEHEETMMPLQEEQARQGLVAQKVGIEGQKNQIEIQKRTLEKSEEDKYRGELTNKLHAVLLKPHDQRTPDDVSTVLLAAQQMNLGEKPEDILRTGNLLTALKTKVAAVAPKLQEAMQKGQKMRIEDPDIINGVGALPGIAGELTKGTDKYGNQAVQKKLKSLLVDEKGNVSFVLEVISKNPKSGELETYEAPVTFGRTADPNGRIVQVPYQMLIAKADISEKMVNNEIVPMLTRMGADAFVQKWTDTQNGMLELQAFSAGAQAMKDMAAVKPTADQNDLRIAAQAAVLKKAQELGVKVDIKKLDDYLKTVAPEKDKAPQTRKINRGGQEIDQEWDSKTSTWKDVGSGPRWKSGEDGETKKVKVGERNIARDLIDRAFIQQFGTSKDEATGEEKTLTINQMMAGLNNIYDEKSNKKYTMADAYNFMRREAANNIDKGMNPERAAEAAKGQWATYVSSGSAAAAKSSNTAKGETAPAGYPKDAKQGADGNWYVPLPGGKWGMVKPKKKMTRGMSGSF